MTLIPRYPMSAAAVLRPDHVGSPVFVPAFLTEFEHCPRNMSDVEAAAPTKATTRGGVASWPDRLARPFDRPDMTRRVER